MTGVVGAIVVAAGVDTDQDRNKHKRNVLD